MGYPFSPLVLSGDWPMELNSEKVLTRVIGENPVRKVVARFTEFTSHPLILCWGMNRRRCSWEVLQELKANLDVLTEIAATVG